MQEWPESGGIGAVLRVMEVSRKNSEILRENLARILEFTNDKKKERIILEETNIIIIYSTLEQLFGQEFWRRAKR